MKSSSLIKNNKGGGTVFIKDFFQYTALFIGVGDSSHCSVTFFLAVSRTQDLVNSILVNRSPAVFAYYRYRI